MVYTGITGNQFLISSFKNFNNSISKISLIRLNIRIFYLVNRFSIRNSIQRINRSATKLAGLSMAIIRIGNTKISILPLLIILILKYFYFLQPFQTLNTNKLISLKLSLIYYSIKMIKSIQPNQIATKIILDIFTTFYRLYMACVKPPDYGFRY